MAYSVRSGAAFVAAMFLVASLATAAHAQSSQYPKPTELPNPYRLVQGWPTLPESMNGGRWGEVIRVHVHSDGNIWVFHRCFNTVPPGIATCLGRGDANPPILQFDPSGKLLKSLGGGMFVNPHGFTVDHEGNLWVSDVNDKETVLGMSARNASGVVLGQEVLKLDQNGKVLMMLGKMGVGGSGTDTFDRPTGVAVAPMAIFLFPMAMAAMPPITAGSSNSPRMAASLSPGVTKDRHPAISMTRTISPLAVRWVDSTLPIASTAVSRFSTRTAISSPRGINLASQARFSSDRMTRFMSVSRSGTRRPDATRRRECSRENCAASWSAVPSMGRCSRSYLIRATSVLSGRVLRRPVLRLTQWAMSMPPMSAPIR